MIDLNLLSPERKKKLKEEKIVFLLRVVSYTLVVFFIISLGLFYGTQIYLDQKLDKINQQITSFESNAANGNQSNFSATIKEINERIKKINGIQNNFIKWSSYLTEFTALIPENITLKEITINRETSVIQLSGRAPLRDDFLALESNLRNSALLKEIQSPISNLIKKEEIDFSLSATMVLESYKL